MKVRKKRGQMCTQPGERPPKRLKQEHPGSSAALSIGNVPEDVLQLVFNSLEEDALVALQGVSRQFCALASSEMHWAALFEDRFGEPSSLMEAAARLAGGWKALYGSKVAAETASAPWATPSHFEVAALVEAIQVPPHAVAPATPPLSPGRANVELQPACAADATQEPPLEVVFLVDGSGSVTEDDFATMQGFIKAAGLDLLAERPGTKLGVIQFSNEVRVELPLDDITPDEYAAQVDELSRLNGGTNIAAAVWKAHRAFLDVGTGAAPRRAVLLLTDGRVDAYQAREAADKVARLRDQISNTQLFALGVGRGIDKPELLRIIGHPGERRGSSEGRFLALRTLDDASW